MNFWIGIFRPTLWPKRNAPQKSFFDQKWFLPLAKNRSNRKSAKQERLENVSFDVELKLSFGQLPRSVFIFNRPRLNFSRQIFWFIPVRETALPPSPPSVAMENDYHNPYDHRRMNGGDDDQLNHYEAPSCLVRNPSGSLFIPPSGKFLWLLPILVAIFKESYPNSVSMMESYLIPMPAT